MQKIGSDMANTHAFSTGSKHRTGRSFAPVLLAIALVCGVIGKTQPALAADPIPASSTQPTSRPLVGPLEKGLIFPGSATQGTRLAKFYPPPQCEVLRLTSNDGVKLLGLFGPAMALDQPPEDHPQQAHATVPTILFFYGNGTCMAESLSTFTRLRELGANVAMADYEGYGLSTGTPSEKGCDDTATALYEAVCARADVNPKQIIVLGWSLGGAVAIDLATRKPVAGLATFSAFTNIDEMAKILAPNIEDLTFLLNSRFDNLSKIAQVRCPIFLAHGTQDRLVPFSMLGRLAKAATSRVTVLPVPMAGHNDIFLVGGESLYQSLGGFVAQCTSAP